MNACRQQGVAVKEKPFHNGQQACFLFPPQEDTVSLSRLFTIQTSLKIKSRTSSQFFTCKISRNTRLIKNFLPKVYSSFSASLLSNITPCNISPVLYVLLKRDQNTSDSQDIPRRLL